MGVGSWLDSRGDQGGGGIVGGDRCERCDRGVVREGFLGLGGKFGIYTWRSGVVCGIVMGVGLQVCGLAVAMHVFAKVGGGVEKKSFSLSQTPPPLFATISIACFNIANIMQIRGFS